MSQACGVSQRTIFRYLNTLSSLNMPEELRVGKPILPGESGSREIDRDDQCLLCYALDHNPLVQYQYLASRLDRIKRILCGGRLPGGGVLQGSVIEVETSPGPRKKTAGDRILSTFVRACQSGDHLIVKVQGSDRETILLPHAIKIQSKGISLNFRVPSRRRYVAHNLSSITSVRLVRKVAGPRSC